LLPVAKDRPSGLDANARTNGSVIVGSAALSGNGYTSKHVHFILEVLILSDFADIFEVKAKEFTRRGHIESDWKSDRQELATREGLDDSCKQLAAMQRWFGWKMRRRLIGSRPHGAAARPRAAAALPVPHPPRRRSRTHLQRQPRRGRLLLPRQDLWQEGRRH
jgi:hypothetical protein